MNVEYCYDLTGNKGKSLFNSLNQSDYDKFIDGQAENYISEGGPGGEWRNSFVDERLWDKLNGDDLDAITDSVPELKGKPNSDVREWLYKNECPFAEEEDIQEWGRQRAHDEASCSMLWDHIDQESDVETALGFGLIRYPECVDGKYIDNGDTEAIPAEIANKISELCDKRNAEEPPVGSSEYTGPSETSKEVDRLEKEAIEKLVLVSGFWCEIHGGMTDFEQPIPKAAVLTCPSCDHPVCSICANCYENDPKTEDEAKEYLKSCDSVSGHAYCGYCGDYSEKFMINFLKLIKCPIPEGYTADKETPPRIARYTATTTVAALPDLAEISAKVKKKFEEGASGIIKVDHPTGEIFGCPERHKDYWLVTICYPHER